MHLLLRHVHAGNNIAHDARYAYTTLNNTSLGGRPVNFRRADDSNIANFDSHPGRSLDLIPARAQGARDLLADALAAEHEQHAQDEG